MIIRIAILRATSLPFLRPARYRRKFRSRPHTERPLFVTLPYPGISICACRCVVVCLCICVRRDAFRDLAMRLSLVVRSYALRVGLRVSGSIPCSSHPSAYP